MSQIPLTVIPAPTGRPPLPPEAVRLVRLSALMARVATGALLLVLGGLALASVLAFRYREATTSAWVLDQLLGRPAHLLASSPTMVFQKAPGDAASWTGLAVTAGHSAVYLVGCTLLVAGLLALLRRGARPSRLLAAAVNTALLLLLVNTVHLVLVAESASRWGSDPSGWVHVVAGQALMLATLSVSVLVWRARGLGGTRR